MPSFTFRDVIVWLHPAMVDTAMLAHPIVASVPAYVPSGIAIPSPGPAAFEREVSQEHELLQPSPLLELLSSHCSPPLMAPSGHAWHVAFPVHEYVPVHSLSGSDPEPMLPHTPSAPEPFFVAEHAVHVPVHVE